MNTTFTGVTNTRIRLDQLLAEVARLDRERHITEARLEYLTAATVAIDGQIAAVIRSAENAGLAEDGLAAGDWHRLFDGIREDVAAACGRHSLNLRR